MKKCCLFFSFLLFFGACFFANFGSNFAVAADLAQGASSALLYDKNSGQIIFEKKAREKRPIASMTKLASLMIIFNAIDRGEIGEQDVVKVSHHAAKTEGSSAFLDEGSEYKVCDLIMTVIICSANDSTVALAEKVAGTEDEFVRRMNLAVKNLGLKDTNFVNATGLPAIDHYSTAIDVAKIYEQICDNPIYKKFSKVWITELIHPSGRKTDIVNTNRLIRSYEGCDSGKTGFTNDAGYCLACSATRSNMRLIGVVMGEANSKTRFNEMAELFNYGFNNFENRLIISNEKPIGEFDVEGSNNKKVQIYAKDNFVKFLKKGEQFEYKLENRFEKIKAPLRAGDEVGQIFVLDDNNIVVGQVPIIVKENVDKIKFKEILIKIFKKI